MGGYGSGRSLGGGRRNTVEEFYCLNVSWLLKRGLIPHDNQSRCVPKRWYNSVTGKITNRVVLTTLITEEGYNDRVDISFGHKSPVKKQYVGIRYTASGVCSRRAWLQCPNCFTKRAKLYAPGPNRHFKCRECLGLVYQSQRHDRMNRLFARTRKIHQQLGGNGNLETGVPRKPWRMHWKTYERKCQEYEYYYEQAYAYMTADWIRFKEHINKS